MTGLALRLQLGMRGLGASRIGFRMLGLRGSDGSSEEGLGLWLEPGRGVGLLEQR